MQPDRLGDHLLRTAAVVGAAGAALALAATAGVLARVGVAHLVGLLVLPAALVLGAYALRLEGSVEGSDALLVLGAFWLHLFALAVAVLAAGWWLVGGGVEVAFAAVAWGLAAAVYALMGYLWDRATGTDVDAVLEAWRG